MKTEKQITDSIDQVKLSLQRTVETLKSEVDRYEWDAAQDTCFTLLVNMAALEAAERILK
jgi:hypothetical protein